MSLYTTFAAQKAHYNISKGGGKCPHAICLRAPMLSSVAYEECGVSPQSIPEFPLRHSSKFNKIKIHTHTHTLFLYRHCLLYTLFL